MTTHHRTFAALLTLLPSLASCDPCGVTLGCEQGPTVAVVGRMVDAGSGEPVGNVEVALAAQGGVALASPVTARTGSNGVFELEAPALGAGEAIVTMTVRAPNRRPYVVPDVRVHTTTMAGSATVFDPWVAADPGFPYVLILYREGTEQGLPNVEVEFRRTSGSPMLESGTETSVIRGTTDSSGWLYLLRGITTDRVGTVVGDLTLRFAPGDSVVLPQVTWDAVPRFHLPTRIVTVSLPRP